MLKLAQIQPGQLADLLQPVHQRVAVYKQLREVSETLRLFSKEALNGHQCLAIQAIKAALLEHLLQEHLAQRGGQLVDQPSDAEILIEMTFLSVSNTFPTSSAICASL